MATSTKPSVDTSQHPFKGRTVSVVNNLSREEQWYLYQKTRELKEAIKAGNNLAPYRLSCPEVAVYTIFMEDSTRTKESFRNAAEFHGLKVNVFDAKTSSFQKNETITDTVKMLCGYSIGQSIFVIRSKMEGVCTWLEEAITEYTSMRGYPRASFINAGDGRHEHPTQEFLDEFSFLEQLEWRTEKIHLALIGDLFHGRTVHSKVDGLGLYDEVEVDLIAPGELALPKNYEDRMKLAGFVVRKFNSLEEYLAQPKVAKLWYFTRLQLERMGDKVLEKSQDLRSAVTFQRQFIPLLPAGTKFFHPLPRDARYPTLPFWLDKTEYNGWDLQSQNGYFTRIVLLGMLGGHLGSDFKPSLAYEGLITHLVSPQLPRVFPEGMDEDEDLLPPTTPLKLASDFIREIKAIDDEKESRSVEVGLAPLQNGMIIDHLAEGQSIEQIWALMSMVRSVLKLETVGGHGVFRSKSGDEKANGLISVPDFDIDKWDRSQLKKLAAMAPGSTLNIIRGGEIKQKYQLQVPPRIYNFSDISCKNTACISHPSNLQREVPPFFIRAPSKDDAFNSWAFVCKYCEHVYGFWQIWDYKGITLSYAV
mmetsp:Transcript_43715/g.103223  ORF Transcript_43715/g.103223 Transcript_43715/m.103223 type:complete len:589 (+) Transcript_43715:137-1903(+)